MSQPTPTPVIAPPRSLIPSSPAASRITFHRNRLHRASSADSITVTGLANWRRQSKTSAAHGQGDSQSTGGGWSGRKRGADGLGSDPRSALTGRRTKGLGMGMQGTPAKRKKMSKASIGSMSTPKQRTSHSRQPATHNSSLTSSSSLLPSDLSIVSADDMTSPSISTTGAETISPGGGGDLPLESEQASFLTQHTLFPDVQNLLVPLNDQSSLPSRPSFPVRSSPPFRPNLTTSTSGSNRSPSSKASTPKASLPAVHGISNPDVDHITHSSQLAKSKWDITVPLNDRDAVHSPNVDTTPVPASVQAASKLAQRQSTPYRPAGWQGHVMPSDSVDGSSQGEEEGGEKSGEKERGGEVEVGRGYVTPPQVAAANHSPLILAGRGISPEMALHQRIPSPDSWHTAGGRELVDPFALVRAVPVVNQPVIQEAILDPHAPSPQSWSTAAGHMDEPPFDFDNPSSAGSRDVSSLELAGQPVTPIRNKVHPLADTDERRRSSLTRPLTPRPKALAGSSGGMAQRRWIPKPESWTRTQDDVDDGEEEKPRWEDPFGFVWMCRVMRGRNPEPYQPSSHLGTPQPPKCYSPISFSSASTATPIHTSPSSISPSPSDNPVSQTQARSYQGAWKGAPALARMEGALPGVRFEIEDGSEREGSVDKLQESDDEEPEPRRYQGRKARKKRTVEEASLSEAAIRAREARIQHYRELDETYRLRVEVVLG
ncbi:hypothetical protein IAT38_003859 [Cryptococcus sp. DSM 104549]